MNQVWIAGVDEVGRGPLAGPVVAGAVILSDPQSEEIAGLADSKKLSESKRQKLVLEIKDKAKAYALGWASAEEIDQINILQASFLAMRRAVEALSLQPGEVWVDGHMLPDWPYPSQAFIKGDQKVKAISAASIIAKVARDDYMKEMAQQYPGFGFEKHKGYPTKQHMLALQELGPCALHRKSFAPVKKSMELADV